MQSLSDIAGCLRISAESRYDMVMNTCNHWHHLSSLMFVMSWGCVSGVRTVHITDVPTVVCADVCCCEGVLSTFVNAIGRRKRVCILLVLFVSAGIRVRLYRTQLYAVPRPPPPPSAADDKPVTPTGGKGKGGAKPSPAKGNKALPEAPPPVEYDIQQTAVHLASGTIQCASLTSGAQFRVADTVSLLPERALWDGRGVRMALKDPRHSQQPVAQCHASLTLHVMPRTA